MVFDISWVWILAAVVAYMAVGALWYSPVLFAGAWMKAAGKKSMSNDARLYVYTAACVLVIVLGLAWLIQGLHIMGWQDGAMLALKAWFFFAATTAMVNRLFQGMNWSLYVIDMSYHLAGMMVAAAILLH